MRKKLNEIRNKEEGFTLVELLAVIVILGIIVAIAVPGIGRVINKADENATEVEKELVVDAAKMFVLSEQDGKIVPTASTGNTQVLTVEDLKTSNYLDAEKTELKGEVTVTKVAKADEVEEHLTYEYSD